MEKYVILYKSKVDGSWLPYTFQLCSDEVVLYDSFYEALHDCRKGERIVKYSQYLASQNK